MNRRQRRALAIAPVVLSLGLQTSCKPVVGREAVVGDSISNIVRDNGGLRWASDTATYPGCTSSCFTNWVKDLVNNPLKSPECAVIEFGPNESADGHITDAESAAYYEMIFTFDPKTSIVLVKPHNTGYTAPVTSALDEWRDDEDVIARTRNRTSVLDLEEHQEYLDELRDDNTHPTAAGAAILDNLYKQACQA